MWRKMLDVGFKTCVDVAQSLFLKIISYVIISNR